MQLKSISILFFGIFVYLSAAMVLGAMTVGAMAADGENGPEKMDLLGGSRGKVPFPHQQHQTRLADCNACHSLFPKTNNAITELKKTDKLKNKQIMNKLCIKCHKAEKKAGNPSGPTTCSKCHVK